MGDIRNPADVAAGVAVHAALPNVHHAQLHAATHESGGGDEINTVDITGGTIDGWTSLTGSGVISTTNATASTSTTTGSGKFAGGVGIGENVFVGGTLDVAGHAAIGDKAAVVATVALYTVEDFGEADETVTAGMTLATASETTGATANLVRGLFARARIGGSSDDVTNTQNWTDTVGMRAVDAYVEIRAGSSGTITGGAAFYADNAVANGASFTNTYGLYVAALTRGTNNYGLYVNTPTGTIADAIHVVGGRSYLGGNVYLNLTLEAGADGVGADGEQLTSGGAAAQCDWSAAGSLREFKILREILNPQRALDAILAAPAWLFNYRPATEDGRHAITTGDYETEYAGVMADEAPWVMHHHGKIFSPGSAFGYTVAAFKAMQAEIDDLKMKLAAT